MVKVLQHDLDSLKEWCQSNKLTINADKTKLMIFGSKKLRDKLENTGVTFNGKVIEEVSYYKYLGVKLDRTLKYELHAKVIIQRVSDKIAYMRRIRRFVNAKAALNIYKNMILPILEYGDILLCSLNINQKKRLQTLQNKALKCALGLDPFTDTEDVHRLAKLETLQVRRDLHTLQLMYKQSAFPFLWKKKRARKCGATTRSSSKKQFILRKFKTEKFKKSVTNAAPHQWNNLPKQLQCLQDLTLFKHQTREYLANCNKDENEIGDVEMLTPVATMSLRKSKSGGGGGGKGGVRGTGTSKRKN